MFWNLHAALETALLLTDTPPLQFHIPHLENLSIVTLFLTKIQLPSGTIIHLSLLTASRREDCPLLKLQQSLEWF